MTRAAKRGLAAVFLVAMLSNMCCSFASAVAKPSDGTQSSSYLSAYRASLTPVPDGKIVCTVDVIAAINADEVGASDIFLYESTDGVHFGSWIKHYNSDDYPSMMGSGWWHAADVFTYQGVVGRYYIADVYVYAADSTGSDTKCYHAAMVRARAT